MAGQENKGPTEEQIKDANDAEFAKWEDDFEQENLDIPYKKDENQKPTNSDDDNDDGADDNNDDEEEQVVTYDSPPPVTVSDPGDYKPADHSFEVTLKDGKTHKVSTPEEADKLAEDADNFETPKQLLDFIRRSQKMETQLDKDKDTWQTQKDTFDEQTKSEQQRYDFINDTAREFDYLVGKKLLPPIDKRYKDADWSDPEVAKQPGIKEQTDLLDFMVRENETRKKANIAPITSVIDAYSAWQLDAKRIAEEKENKESGERRKRAGARIAGVSPSQQGTSAPKGIAVGNPNVFKRSAAIWDN